MEFAQANKALVKLTLHALDATAQATPMPTTSVSAYMSESRDWSSSTTNAVTAVVLVMSVTTL